MTSSEEEDKLAACSGIRQTIPVEPLDLRVIEQVKDHLRTLEKVSRVDLSASMLALSMLAAEVQQARTIRALREPT